MTVRTERLLLPRYYDLTYLNGESIQYCIDKLIEVKQLLDVEGILDVDEYGSIFYMYEVEETDELYYARIARETAIHNDRLSIQEQKAKIVELEQYIQKLTKQLEELK
jgi:hypothetical protein